MRKKTLLLIALPVSVSLLIFIYYYKPHIIYPNNLKNMKAYIIFDYDYYIMDKMDSIKVGMNENDVVSILGQPKFIDYDSNITIYFGDKSLYGKVVENPNKFFCSST